MPVARCGVVRHAATVEDVGDDRAPSPASFQHVLLPLDGSSFALAALPTARALAERFAAHLLTISVASDDAEAGRLRRQALEALGESTGDDEIDVVVAAEPAPVIAGRVEELGSAVVCMSTRGRGSVAGALIGSVARSVLQLSKTPVVVLGPQADRPGYLVGRPRRRPLSWPEPFSVGRLLACVDGSASSEVVLPAAASWAIALDMDLSVLTVAEDSAADLSGTRPNKFGPPDPQQYVDGLADQWRGTVPSVGEVVYHPLGVASGVRSSLDARPTGLVALTTHARSGLERIRLGATAADIVRTSTAPALVVPLRDG